MALADTETVAKEPERLTREHAIVGTAGYMSPEQIRGKELDAQTDLFSFGAVFYEMANKIVFRGRKFGVALRSHPPRRIAASIRAQPRDFAELAAVMHKALEKDRNLRYQHVFDLPTDLQRLKRDEDTGRRISGSTKAASGSEKGEHSEADAQRRCT